MSATATRILTVCKRQGLPGAATALAEVEALSAELATMRARMSLVRVREVEDRIAADEAHRIAASGQRLSERRAAVSRRRADCMRRDHPAARFVLGVVAEVFGVQPCVVLGTGRGAAIDRARHIAAHLLYRVLESYPRVGAVLGGRHHSTVIHSARRVAAARESSAGFNDQVSRLEYRAEQWAQSRRGIVPGEAASGAPSHEGEA